MSDTLINGNMVDESLLEHVVGRLRQAAYTEQPYPHFHLTELLPWDIYHRLIENMPALALYQTFSDKHKMANGQHSRLKIILDDPIISRMSDPQIEIWHKVYTLLHSEQLKQAIFDKLAPGLAYRYSIAEENCRELDAYPTTFLFRESEGYLIKPHPDTRKKMVTFQVALPADDSQKHLGTSMYKQRFLPKDLSSQPRGFCEIGRYPFLPNSAFAFVVINTLLKKSWHGREALTAADGIRHSLLNVYYEKPQFF